MWLRNIKNIGTSYCVYVHFITLSRQMLRELVPADLLKIQNANDWKRSIVAAYNQDAGKLLYLKFCCLCL
jgi:hypothetical protein